MGRAVYWRHSKCYRPHRYAPRRHGYSLSTRCFWWNVSEHATIWSEHESLISIRMWDTLIHQLGLFDLPSHSSDISREIASTKSEVQEKVSDKVSKYISKLELNWVEYILEFDAVEYRENLVSKIMLKLKAGENKALNNTKFTIFIENYRTWSYYDAAAEQEYETIKNKSLSAIQLTKSTKWARFIGKDGIYINTLSYFSYLDRTIMPKLTPFIWTELDRAIIHFHYQKNNRVKSLAK